MTELKDQKCEACRVGAPRVTDEEMQSLLPRIPEWELKQVDGIKRLVRTFIFPNFKEALAFTDKVGEAAETEGHHPAILTEWGKVTVSWWTHKIKGLHVNDFVMAAKTDDISVNTIPGQQKR
jgi:4a-hydroxytetrahydrobiopterin dehydratase